MMTTKRYFIDRSALPEQFQVCILMNEQYCWKASFSRSQNRSMKLENYSCGLKDDFPALELSHFKEVDEKTFNKKVGNRASFIHWAVSAYYVSLCAINAQHHPADSIKITA